MFQNKNNMQNLYIIGIDCIAIMISFFISNFIRHHSFLKFGGQGSILGVLALLILSYLFLYLAVNMNRDFVMRGYIVEGISVVKVNGIMMLISICSIYFTRIVMEFSRGVMVLFFCINCFFMYVSHQGLKYYWLHIYKNSKKNRQLLLVTLDQISEQAIQALLSEKNWEYKVAAAAVLDKNQIGKRIQGVPVVADRRNLIEYCKGSYLDEAYFYTKGYPEKDTIRLVKKLYSMGITIHMNIDLYSFHIGAQKTVSKFGSLYAVTLANQIMPMRRLILKRLMDILGSLIGCFFTLLIAVIFGPAIKLESKGPVFYSQIRVGKNGRFFKMYKFRSMYVDADVRKKELLEKNEADGFMFKITDDPRITKVGRILRKTSLDECPQFFNVLKGDMSLVGTRPPTLDEFEKYRSYHKRRLSITPGLTGLWQISGRSKVTDFEEVVRMDVEYIDNWSLGLDLKILMKTIGVVIRGDGAK